MPKSKDSPEIRRQLKEREGAFCMYRERPLIVHARLEEVDMDDWGVALTLRDLDTPGFIGVASSRPDSPSFTVKVSWEWLGFSENRWSAAYAGWAIHFDEGLLEALCAAAQSVVGEDRETRYAALVAAFSSHKRESRPSWLKRIMDEDE